MENKAGFVKKILILLAIAAAVSAVIFFMRCERAMKTGDTAITDETETGIPPGASETMLDRLRRAAERNTSGTSDALSGDFDAYAARVTTDGRIIWEKYFDEPMLESAEYAASCADGSLIIAGRKYDPDRGDEDFFMKKLSAGGGLIWKKMLSEYDYSIADAIDGGFVIAGKITGPGKGGSSFYITETDEKGEYRKVINFSTDFAGWGYRSIESHDGAYLTVGLSEAEFIDAGGIHLSKKNKKGGQEWSRVYGGEGYDRGFSIEALSDGVIIAGMTTSFGGGGTDAYFIKADFDGNCLWARTAGTVDNEEVYSAIAGKDGAIHGCGVFTTGTESGLLYVGLEADGTPLKMVRFKSALNCAGFAIAHAGKDEFYIAGIRRK